MKKNEIVVGGHYTAKVSGKLVTVRVDAIRSITKTSGDTIYDVTNLKTDRKTTFRSAAKFRAPAKGPTPPSVRYKGGQEEDPMAPHAEVEQRPDPQSIAGCVKEPASPDLVQDVRPAEDQAGVNCPRCDQTVALVDGRYDYHRKPIQGHSYMSDIICGMSGEVERSQRDDDPEEGEQRQSPPSCGNGSDTSVEEGEQGADPTQPKPTSNQPSTSAEPHSSTSASIVTMSDVPSIAAQTITGLGIASKIAAARCGRERGSLVAGMIPNEEQEAILEAAWVLFHGAGPRVLVVAAGAGTGKTATDKMLEEVLPGRGQYTAFNASLVAEAKTKFKKCAVNTTHSLAFRAVGNSYQHRLGGETVRSDQVARILGIEPITIMLEGMGAPGEDGKPTDKHKLLRADFLAGQVIAAVRRFCQSADAEIGRQHLRYIDGIDAPRESGERGSTNNQKVSEYLTPFLERAWDDISRTDGQLPFTHDCYVKLWQLGTGDDRPVIPADYILLDEAQDTAPVFLDVIRQQEHALIVLVGDSNQSIYEWRGAVDAMKSFPGAERRLLSQSYRFGQAIADVANSVLATLDEPTDLVMRGMPSIPSRVARVAEPDCYLYRTNAGAIGQVMLSVSEGRKPCLIGGKNYVADMVRWMQAVVDLQARRGTRHPELCCFDTWSEVVEYSKTDEGGDMRVMVKLVETFGAARICRALKDMPGEDEADHAVGTAHRSKGREWDTVKLGQDFPPANKMCDPDRKLLYVTATRARLTLDISECPPFCGQHSRKQEGDTGWVPGLKITYTEAMPSEEEQQEWSVARVGSDPAERAAPDRAAPATLPSPTAQRADKPTATYAKLKDGSWGIRSSAELRAGQVVVVTTRAGQRKEERVGRVVWSGNRAWIATVAR